MNTIQEPPIHQRHNPSTTSKRRSRNNTRNKSYFIDLANMICSRESTYRTALDIVAFDGPMIGSDLLSFRGIKKLAESFLEAGCGTVFVVIAPLITSFVGTTIGRFLLPTRMRKDTLNYLKFTRDELESMDKFKIGIDRIKEEETEDKHFIASLYRRAGKFEKVKQYNQEANEIKRFHSKFKPSREKLDLARRLKKYTIIGESLLEGGWWGGYGLFLRAFRKYILKEDRFTGTQSYLSDAESEQLGESGNLSLFQKIIGIGSIGISPILNTILLNKTEDKKAVKKSKFLQVVKDQLDMTHGLYPKLGLLFTYTTIPKWTSVIALSQGWLERGERILKLLTVVSSWWCGHWLTNGFFALSADKQLKEKYKTKSGVLVEPSYYEGPPKNDSWFSKLTRKLPEPAKIHHVMKRTRHNPKLQKEAEELHASSLYKGFLAHGLGVFAINMGVNQIVKTIALKAAGR